MFRRQNIGFSCRFKEISFGQLDFEIPAIRNNFFFCWEYRIELPPHKSCLSGSTSGLNILRLLGWFNSSATTPEILTVIQQVGGRYVCRARLIQAGPFATSFREHLLCTSKTKHSHPRTGEGFCAVFNCGVLTGSRDAHRNVLRRMLRVPVQFPFYANSCCSTGIETKIELPRHQLPCVAYKLGKK